MSDKSPVAQVDSLTGEKTSTTENRGHESETVPIQPVVEETVVHIGWRSWLVIFLTSFAIVAQVFVTTGIAPNMVFIAKDLGNPAMVGWVVQAPLLMQSILSPFIGRLSDVFDRKWMVSIPPLIALAGAAISARATSMNMLIGGGILIGVTLPTAAIVHAIQAEILPMKYRAIASGCAFVGASIGGFAGSLGGGALTDLGPGGWRYAFWLQAALHGITSLGFLLFYWPKRRSDYPKMPLGKSIWLSDPIGAALFITGSTLILIALNWAGGVHKWSSAQVAATFSVGVFTFILFLLYEWKGRDDGLIPHVLFRNGHNFILSVLSFFVEGWILYGALNQMIPQETLNLGFENNAFRNAARLLAYQGTGAVFSVIVSLWATYAKDLKTPLFFTWTVFFICAICHATLSPDQGKPQLFYGVLSGIGQSGPLVLLLPLIQFATPHEYLSTSSGVAYSGRAISGAFGSAALGAIVNGYLIDHYGVEVGKAAVDAGLPPTSAPSLVAAIRSRLGPKVVQKIPGITPTIIAAATRESHWVYARAYRLAWWSMVPLIVLAIVFLIFIRNVRELMTEKVQATVERVPDDDREKSQG